MVRIFVFSQNLVIDSLKELSFVEPVEKCVFVTTNSLFDEEKDLIRGIFRNCSFICFGDVLTDAENEKCDLLAYKNTYTVQEYYDEIKRIKNRRIIQKITKKYPEYEGFLICDDLGIYRNEWVKARFKDIELKYYYNHPTSTRRYLLKQKLKEIGIVRFGYDKIRTLKKSIRQNKSVNTIDCDVHSGEWNGRKYIFIGRLDRIGYRLDINWTLNENEKNNINKGVFYKKDECTYLTTLHESSNNVVPDESNYEVYYIQDGYLPPNYSSYYLKFKPRNVKYYVWDKLGLQLFKNQNIPAEIMPFRINKYIPETYFKDKVRTILVATSGPGDWTAQKNRSDEDLLVKAFCTIAERHPEIQIIYRCHPTWIHPEHNGVNSINRVAELFKTRGLCNITLSTNIPSNDTDNFRVSFPRQSLESDLKKADIVFGEHSVSMIDAAMQGIPFASVNLSKRRNLFCGITDCGFPHCTSIEEIERVLAEYGTAEFSKKFADAVRNYNAMTNEK
ncbi:MAG: hypothetical protein E7294_04675 [Lachnospiraceae bacterium]|jgi:hypothetical protein|nr:hypothetical protein [Lachnospiraceae bacterium]